MPARRVPLSRQPQERPQAWPWRQVGYGLVPFQQSGVLRRAWKRQHWLKSLPALWPEPWLGLWLLVLPLLRRLGFWLAWPRFSQQF